ncbi:hypothetical protein BYT27DRAFT_6482857 [Phlegmacium glaucopus]|nr:hypothetical protein BYT27DRAFT_6482857 [Phlegmacium glaucopus]
MDLDSSPDSYMATTNAGTSFPSSIDPIIVVVKDAPTTVAVVSTSVPASASISAVTRRSGIPGSESQPAMLPNIQIPISPSSADVILQNNLESMQAEQNPLTQLSGSGRFVDAQSIVVSGGNFCQHSGSGLFQNAQSILINGGYFVSLSLGYVY